MTHANTTTNGPAAAAANGPVNGTVNGRRLYPVPTTGPAVPADLAARLDAHTAQARAWLPPVDPAVFDCYLGTLAHAADPYNEGDPIAVLASLIAVAGVHVGPDVRIPIAMDHHPLLVWPLLIGHTAEGKKGTSWSATKTLLTAAAPEFVAMNVHSGLSSGEGLAAVFATDDGEGDVTADGKAKRKQGRKAARVLPDGDLRLLTYEPEWAATMARMKREGNTLAATLRAAWEGGNLSTLNVDARVARRGHVGIVAHITPGEFKAKVTASDMAGGTYNRFLPLAVAQSKMLPHPDPMPAALLADLGAALAHRLEQVGGVTTVGLAPTVRDTWTALYLELSPANTNPGPDGERIKEFTSRAPAYCLRIAALYAALDGTSLIQPGHLAAAAALIRYSLASAAAVLESGADPARLAALAAFIAEAGEQGRARTEITKGFFKGRPKDDDAMLSRLVDNGDVTVTVRARPGGGKGTTIYTAADPAKFANFRT